MNMLVGLVTPRYAPAIGGIERHVEALARGLVARGVGVEVITTDPTGLLPATEVLDGVLVRRFRTVANDAVFFVAPGLGRWLRVHAGRFDVLHAHSYHTPLAVQAALAARHWGVALVLTPHYHGTGHSAFRRLLHWPYRPVGHWLMRQARQVLCVSATEQALVARHFGAQVPSVVLPNAVEVADLVAAQPLAGEDAGRVVLTVGRLEAYKQVDRLIEVLPYLPPEFRLVVVGEGPLRPTLEGLIAQHGLEQRVRLLGHVALAELLGWYRSADVFVSLSQHEAFGITVLEGAVGGAGVVASAIPAHVEVARYLPEGLVQFVDVGASPALIAGAIERAAEMDRPQDVEQWPLPTWDRLVDGALASYQLSITAVRGTRGLNRVPLRGEDAKDAKTGRV